MIPREQGFALVAVLVAIAVAAGLAAAALSFARAGTAGATGYAAEIEGGHAAEAAVRLTAIRLADEQGYGLREVALGSIDWAGWRVAVRVEDEAGKLDLNRGPRDRIAAALTQFGVDRRRAAAVLSQADRRFVALDELAAELGLPARSMPRLRRLLTVHGGDSPRPPGIRSELETYRIVAAARRGGRSVGREGTVRLTPGFAEPFEWLEKGRFPIDAEESSNLPGN